MLLRATDTHLLVQARKRFTRLLSRAARLVGGRLRLPHSTTNVLALSCVAEAVTRLPARTCALSKKCKTDFYEMNY